MKRAVRRALLLSALAAPSALYALGLGEIRLNSALNQPFDAEIELVSAAPEDLDALRAALAPTDTFQRYGLDKPAFLSDFTFRVTRSGGRDVLRITSPRPVTEPFVTLLVEASWPRGRLLREYTVLLDPPALAAAPVAAAPAPSVLAPPPVMAAPATDTAPLPPSAPAPVPRAAPTVPAPRASVEPGSTYRVRTNDTLWRIASAASPGPNSEVNRTMVAIYEANPSAFGGNINVLRAGSELRIPARSDVSAISAAAAADEVARQYRLWNAGADAGAPAAEAGGRLRLVTPERGSPAPSPATSPAAAPAAGAPSAAPGPTAAATNADLQNQVQRLEAELAEARRLLEVRNAELATLQGAAAPPAPDTTAEPVVPGTSASPVPDAPPGEVQAVTEPKPAAEPEPAPPKKPKRKAAPPPVEEPSLLDRLSDFWYVPLGLLAAALGAAFWRRRRRVSEPAENRLEEALARPTSGDLRARSLGTGRPGESDIVVEERHPTEHVATGAASAVSSESARRATTVADTLSGDGPVSIEAGDPLAEADFHMAYGLYDQAADLVQVALKREPQRRELRLKLVEIFFVWGNRERFLESARQLHSTRAQAEPAEWDKVLIMGRQIAPDDPLFSEKALSPSAHLDLELQGGAATTDFELSEGSAGPLDLELTALAPQVRGDDSVDFLLDEPQRGGDDAAALAPTVETPRVSSPVEDPTAEVAIEELGLEPGDLDGLDDLARLDATLKGRRLLVVEDTVEQPLAERGALVEDTVQENMAERRSAFEDTVEQPRAERGILIDDTVQEHMTARRSAFEDTVQQPIVRRGQDEALEPDLLSTTSMLRVDLEELGREALAADLSAEPGTEIIDLSGPTGEMPTVEVSDLDVTGELARMDLKGEGDITMSEVGTKLDLARAYIDMGDPEGARSILEEVLKEGSAGHKLEAERLMAGLP